MNRVDRLVDGQLNSRLGKIPLISGIEWLKALQAKGERPAREERMSG